MRTLDLPKLDHTSYVQEDPGDWKYIIEFHNTLDRLDYKIVFAKMYEDHESAVADFMKLSDILVEEGWINMTWTSYSGEFIEQVRANKIILFKFKENNMETIELDSFETQGAK